MPRIYPCFGFWVGVMTSAFRFCIKFSMVQLRCRFLSFAWICVDNLTFKVHPILSNCYLQFPVLYELTSTKSATFLQAHLWKPSLPWGGCGSSFAQFCLASPWFPFPEINVCLLNGALINWNWNGCSASPSPPPFPKQPPSHFANIIARVLHCFQESRILLEGVRLCSIVPLSRTLVESWSPACRIYIPNGRLWNWEHDGASWSMIMMMMLSIRRIQSRNLSIYYSVIQWLKEIWK